MKAYLQQWNLMRIIRLALALIIFGQGFIVKDWTFFVMGALLALMAFMNIGCCGTAGCSLPTSSKTNQHNQNISYEEVDGK